MCPAPCVLCLVPGCLSTLPPFHFSTVLIFSTTPHSPDEPHFVRLSGSEPLLSLALRYSRIAQAGGEVYSNEKRRVKREKRRYIYVFHFSLLSFLFSLVKNFPYCRVCAEGTDEDRRGSERAPKARASEGWLRNSKCGEVGKDIFHSSLLPFRLNLGVVVLTRQEGKEAESKTEKR